MTISADPIPTTVVVATQSAWASKINWAQAVGGIAMLLAWFSGGKINLSPEQQVTLVAAIGIVTNLVTWVFKTWFTKTITPASVANATTTAPIITQAPIVHVT